MNKQFFAQYLPDISGKLIVFNNGGIETRFIGKLFICSREIKIGDILTHPIHGQREFTKEENEKWGVKTYTDKHWYNVIGEVSPDAAWVKNHDQFDASEIKVKRGHKNTMNIITYCEILNSSCKHFH